MLGLSTIDPTRRTGLECNPLPWRSESSLGLLACTGPFLASPWATGRVPFAWEAPQASFYFLAFFSDGQRHALTWPATATTAYCASAFKLSLPENGVSLWVSSRLLGPHLIGGLHTTGHAIPCIPRGYGLAKARQIIYRTDACPEASASEDVPTHPQTARGKSKEIDFMSEI